MQRAGSKGVRAVARLGLAIGMIAVSGLVTSAAAAGASTSTPALGLVWVLPFVGLLLSIALFPLLAPSVWHHHDGKIAALCALAVIVPYGLLLGWPAMTKEFLHTILLDYIPFIILIGALYTVSGGLFIKGQFSGRPVSNTALLAFGTVIASFVGTTGASMLMIRPLIRANKHREYAIHVFVFFIFLVSNIGGALTPLGDPPLFIGFLQGVDFFWTVKAMWPVTLMVTAILLALFFAIDLGFSLREKRSASTAIPAGDRAFGVDGLINLVLLAALIGIVLWSGIAARTSAKVNFFGTDLPLTGLIRDGALVAVAWLSLLLTPKLAREENGFTFGPMIEVAELFAGIFITIVPVLIILKSGKSGALSGLVDLVTLPGGRPNDAMYFWLSGTLSSFLDNAPTYLVFFNLPGVSANDLMGPLARTLMAISAGSVFMGANSYIGNAPNFMVKAVCEEQGVRMPSFFGYMLWSVGILVPIFVLVTFVFFR